MAAAQPFDAATDAKYVQLTTFRKDGTPVASPLWAAAEGETLIMWTETTSWKVKRIRRDPHVVVQACDARGKNLRGRPVEGSATILDGAGTEHARQLIAKKYGIVGWILVKASRLRRGEDGTVGISITPR
ncbi:PPOX class F420-dependent oxidoreductase [Gordonia otitidis]|uniref:Pyridoxamine 5'-phosphate oxidase N-terminal domain-containing protein n=1 Tax=Gordonia otitidis (strain DSM 44809 / CCUG 52243 / JCM 12355 / NBRC 100426 / IFM 10032) TaxID=1108044 RepID=H5TM51_GORO1|nr:PPOX class F420-dependent oxidoreductase [Gordonia otitidis]GAB34559.1 hypothetical protein GOOTI_113_00210 [Gordonia otitidis NBRC 100426]